MTEIQKELDKLNGCTIVGSCYSKEGVFDTLSLQLEKKGQTLQFNIAFRYLLILKATEKK